MNPFGAIGAAQAGLLNQRTAPPRALDGTPNQPPHDPASWVRRSRIGVQRPVHPAASRRCTMLPREGRGPARGLRKPECLARVEGVRGMRRDDITELHYICPLETVSSILRLGILSHEAAGSVSHESIANQKVQARRAQVRIPGGKRLHSYVNLYLNGRNPMMFTVCKTKGTDSVCLLRVKLAVMDSPGVVMTDRNASSSAVRFAEPDSGLARLDKEVIFARYWTHSEPIRQYDHKSRMCAEVLVPSTVDPEMITGAYVASSAAQDSLRRLVPKLPVSVDKNKFFK